MSEGKCRFNRNNGQILQVFVFCWTFLVEYIVPVILISYLYIRILLVLRHKLDNANANQRDGVLGKAKRNVILTMLIAGCMFFICWTPNQMLRLILSTDVIKGFSVKRISDVFTGLVMCNMSVNPVVYCFKYEHFRVQLKQLVRSHLRRNRVRPGEESNDAPSLSIDPIQNTATTQAL